MARGGRRTYTRDSRGRFASTPGGGLGAARKAARSQSGRASTLGARTSLKASRAKLRAKDPADQRMSTTLSARAQKGAVTRGNKGLKAAKVAAKSELQKTGKAGIIKKTRKASGLMLQQVTKLSKPVNRSSKDVNIGKSTTSKMTANTILDSRAKGSRIKQQKISGTISKPKKLKADRNAMNKLVQSQKDKKRDQSMATLSAKRSKPKETLQFPGQGIKGPTGAVLKAYTWQWQWGSVRNKEGDEVGKRVSNWDAATQSAATGRNVVHQFVVEQNGKRSVVSAEGAIKQLGYAGESVKKFGSLKSSLKTLAKLKMEQATLQRQMDVIDRIRKETKAPKITVKKIEPQPWTKDNYYQIKAGRLSISQPANMKDGLIDKNGNLWSDSKDKIINKFRNEAIKRVTGKSPYSIIAEMKEITRRIEKQQEKINKQI